MEKEPNISDINSTEDLARYVAQLRGYLDTAPDRWENNTLESYLEAMSGWLIDCKGYYRSQDRAVPDAEALQAVAEVITASMLYE